MRVKIAIVLLLRSITGFVSGLDIDSVASNFKTLWPNLTKLGLRPGNVLLVDPKLIFDQSSVDQSSVKFLDGEDFTKLFIKHPTTNGMMYFRFFHKYGFTMLGYSLNPNEGFDATMEASIFCIPGNGSIYAVDFIRGTEIRLYYARKFTIDYDQVTEVDQAFISLNVISRTNEDVDVFSDSNLTNKVATVGKNASLTVVGTEFQKHHIELYPTIKVLVTTQSGVTGWALNRIIKSEHQSHTTSIDVFDFNTLSGS